MFFGRVVDNEYPNCIVNPKTENAFSVLNMEQKGNNVNVTDVYTDAESQSASDLNISPSNRRYRWIFDRWASNLPLDNSTGRITNSYLRIKMIKKNWTTNPTVLTGSVKILQYIKTFFEQKR
jgi:hypothetical protein